MMRIAAVIAEVRDVREPELRDWVARGWVQVEPGGTDDYVFAEIDVARVRLIRDLRHAMAVEEETVTLVLSLLDQVYDLRRTLRTVVGSMDEQPLPVREAMQRVLRDRL
jgi:chaperone modulatory protein CbpM